MNYFKIAFIAVLLISGSNALFTDTLSNLIGGVTDTITGTINTGLNTINGAIFGGQFLWDNAIAPSLQVLQNNSIDFVDNHFGNVLSLIGKRSAEAKNQMKIALLEQTNELVANLKQIFINYVVQLKLQLSLLYPSFVPNQTTTAEAVKQLTENTKNEIEHQVQTTIQNLKVQYENQPALMFVVENTVNKIKTTVFGVMDFVAANLSH